jgi:hypothetical protein
MSIEEYNERARQAERPPVAPPSSRPIEPLTPEITNVQPMNLQDYTQRARQAERPALTIPSPRPQVSAIDVNQAGNTRSEPVKKPAPQDSVAVIDNSDVTRAIIGRDLSRADVDKILEKYSDDNNLGMSARELRDFFERITKNPDAPEFQNLSPVAFKVFSNLSSLFEVPSSVTKKVTENNYVEVGTDDPNRSNHQWISREDFEAISKNSPNLADVLKKNGVEAYSADTGTIVEHLTANREQWFKENIESDPYLNSVLKSGKTREAGEELALAAYDKRQNDLKSIYERSVLPKMPVDYQEAYKKGDSVKMAKLTAQYNAEYDKWINDNIKNDRYLNGIYITKGENKALEAWQKRQNDLQGISPFFFIPFLPVLFCLEDKKKFPQGIYEWRFH